MVPDAQSTPESSSDDTRIRIGTELRCRVDAVANRLSVRPAEAIEMAFDCLEEATVSERVDAVTLSISEHNRAAELLAQSTLLNAVAVYLSDEILGQAKADLSAISAVWPRGNSR